MSYQIKLEAFKGPFDLLIHLIEKNKLNIYDIPIAEITKQYMEYLEKMSEMDLEITSQFLVMASRLISIKARMLLPKPQEESEEEEDDPRDELISHLIEYKRFKAAADFLQEQSSLPVQVYPRNMNEEHNSIYVTEAKDNTIEGLTLDKLTNAFKRAIELAAQDGKTAEVKLDLVTVEDKMTDIMRKLLYKDKRTSFEELLLRKGTVKELVTTFLAVLELVKNKFVIIEQNMLFGEIYIYRNNNIEYDFQDSEV
ncbi:segregation and condensation protein A [Desulfitispora alkaliphila]|uniref:segregation and condensation protein A n=1 Tax=Desulfitispora alkaliphila TaxID=622674 RepID=UPI003D1FC28D